MRTQLAGTTFRDTTVKPMGEVKCFGESFNPHDPKAVRVHFKGEFVGYLPRGSESQRMFNFHPSAFKAKGVDYCFSRGVSFLDEREFNNDDAGYLASCTIEYEGRLPKKEKDTDLRELEDGRYIVWRGGERECVEIATRKSGVNSGRKYWWSEYHSEDIISKNSINLTN